ncbi:NAD(P)-dependent oxidoreductase [Hydrogenibacillus schlegelii]|uniref:NAD(P)-dependent oxidoreductase n=1 Tax=Hydrogenibacillus schlegelii TaxID=1484 RepID=UPI0034A024D2
MEDFLPEADIVVVVLPLTSASAGRLDRRRVSAMEPGALVGHSRGGGPRPEGLLGRVGCVGKYVIFGG